MLQSQASSSELDGAFTSTEDEHLRVRPSLTNCFSFTDSFGWSFSLTLLWITAWYQLLTTFSVKESFKFKFQAITVHVFFLICFFMALPFPKCSALSQMDTWHKSNRFGKHSTWRVRLLWRKSFVLWTVRRISVTLTHPEAIVLEMTTGHFLTACSSCSSSSSSPAPSASSSSAFVVATANHMPPSHPVLCILFSHTD